MRYVSIDLETTGLDPSRDQILEVGAAWDDLENQRPLAELSKFHAYVARDRVEGHPKALAMNASTLGRIANRETPWTYLSPEQVAPSLRNWLDCASSVVAAGKNFGSFDLQFLKRLPGADCLKFKHRSLDPGMLFLRPGDREPPSLDLCLERAGIADRSSHNALDDALLVVKVLRAWYGLVKEAHYG